MEIVQLFGVGSNQPVNRLSCGDRVKKGREAKRGGGGGGGRGGERGR